MNNIPCLSVILLNEINVLLDCGGIYQEIAQSGKQEFVLCELTKSDVANYYRVIPISNSNYNSRTIHKNDYIKIPHKEFDVINERYKAQGFCNIMNKRLQMLNTVEQDYKNNWIDTGSFILWFDGQNWYNSIKPFTNDLDYKMNKTDLIKRLMTCDWEYNSDKVKLCKLNIFKRILNKLIKN